MSETPESLEADEVNLFGGISEGSRPKRRRVTAREVLRKTLAGLVLLLGVAVVGAGILVAGTLSSKAETLSSKAIGHLIATGSLLVGGGLLLGLAFGIYDGRLASFTDQVKYMLKKIFHV